MIFKSLVVVAWCLSITVAGAASAPDPFANSQVPVPGGFKGATFVLSHDYPAKAPAPSMPWRTAIKHQRLSPANARLYAEALKAAIAVDMRVLLQDYEHWDAGQRGWFNEPWMGSIDAEAAPASSYRGNTYREPLRGMYVGTNQLAHQLFSTPKLEKDISTYVLTFYNRTAAVTLNAIWHDPLHPEVNKQSTQFAEGSVIVKAAFVTADCATWKAMCGTAVWPAFINVNATIGQQQPPKGTPALVTPTNLMQFDIIVKDSVSSPETGWVFSTLVYDERVGGPDIWEKMVVLGAQWGNDPEARNPARLRPVLKENWINPNAPAYGSATLGWGQRLSGPNDGAMNDVAYAASTVPSANMYVRNAKDSSCMSCHSSAQWDPARPRSGMPSFLLPALTQHPQSPPDCKGERNCNSLVSPAPGSALWMKWFTNRPGDVPMDNNATPNADNTIVAADFDMVLTFKSLPAWYQATHSGEEHVLMNYDLRGRRLTPGVSATR